MNRVIAILALLAGCHSEIPMYPWEGEAAVRETITRRYADMGGVTAEGRVELISSSGQSVTMDCALAALGTDKLRLRAWKFQHAVFDLTLNPSGLYVWFAESAGARDDGFNTQVTAHGLSQGWSWVTGSLLTRTPEQIAESNGTLLAEYTDPDILARIDIGTRTLRRVETAGSNSPDTSVELKDYKMFQAVAWPARLVFSSPDGGQVIVRLRNVQVRQELSETLFTPPARARLQP